MAWATARNIPKSFFLDWRKLRKQLPKPTEDDGSDESDGDDDGDDETSPPAPRGQKSRRNPKKNNTGAKGITVQSDSAHAGQEDIPIDIDNSLSQAASIALRHKNKAAARPHSERSRIPPAAPSTHHQRRTGQRIGADVAPEDLPPGPSTAPQMSAIAPSEARNKGKRRYGKLKKKTLSSNV